MQGARIDLVDLADGADDQLNESQERLVVGRHEGIAVANQGFSMELKMSKRHTHTSVTSRSKKKRNPSTLATKARLAPAVESQ